MRTHVFEMLVILVVGVLVVSGIHSLLKIDAPKTISECKADVPFCQEAIGNPSQVLVTCSPMATLSYDVDSGLARCTCGMRVSE